VDPAHPVAGSDDRGVGLGWEGVEALGRREHEDEGEAFFIDVGDRLGEGLATIGAHARVSEVELVVDDEAEAEPSPNPAAPEPGWADFGDLTTALARAEPAEPPMGSAAPLAPGSEPAGPVDADPEASSPRRWRDLRALGIGIVGLAAARLLWWLALLGGHHR